MEVDTQAQLIREFMLAVAPSITRYSLETGAGVIENASLVLEWSMQLAARYNELYEMLTSTAQDSPQTLESKTSTPTARVRSPQARIPLDPYNVPDLP